MALTRSARMNTIETERLLIRKWEIENDTDAAFEMYGDAETMVFIPGGVKTREQTRASLERMIAGDQHDGFGIWPVVLKAERRVIGACGIFYIPEHAPDVEIAWVFHKAYHGRGFATEAAGAVKALALNEVGLPILYALIHQDNTPSIRLALRLGMTHSGKIHAYDRELQLYECHPSP